MHPREHDLSRPPSTLLTGALCNVSRVTDAPLRESGDAAAWGAVSPGKPRWPALQTVEVAIVFQLVLPQTFVRGLGDRPLIPALEDLLLPLMSAQASAPGRAPGFLDYPYPSFTKASVLGLTGSMPPTARALLLMAPQSPTSSITLCRGHFEGFEHAALRAAN